MLTWRFVTLKTNYSGIIGLMKHKAIIFDIDGTAIDSPTQKVPSNRLISAVHNVEDDYFVCAATGRVWSFAEPVLKGLSLVDPCIISAGTQICDPRSGEIIWQCEIEKVDLALVLQIIQDYPENRVLYNDYNEDTYLNGGLNIANLQINESVYFFELIFVPEIIAPEIVARLSAIEGIAVTLVVAHRKGFNDIHITNRNATKEHAVGELLKMIRVNAADTIGVGDGHNDIHLFNAVNKKVAMVNAVKELKANATEIIGTVKEDGFAEYLEALDQK